MLNKIAVFDSGVGGLGTLNLLCKHKIAKEIIYYADNKNVPFGNKSKEEILKIGQAAINYLSSQNIDLIILACNTVSSILPELTYSAKVLPISDFAKIGLKNIENNQNTLVVATKATLNSGIYQKVCEQYNIKADFINPVQFVPIVESMDFSKADDYFKEYFHKNNYDYVLYACTHYPFLNQNFVNFFKNASMIDPAKILLSNLLKDEKDKIASTFTPKIVFQASKDTKILKIFYERMCNG